MIHTLTRVTFYQDIYQHESSIFQIQNAIHDFDFSDLSINSWFSIYYNTRLIEVNGQKQFISEWFLNEILSNKSL